MNWRTLGKKLMFWRSSEAPRRGCEISGWSSQGIHPLFIDHVLENVLQLVLSQNSASGAAREIRKLRLVCRFWRDVATTVYTSDKIVTKLRIGPETRNCDHMESFLDVVGTLIPIRYEIHGSLRLRENQTLLWKFMIVCGGNAKSFTFNLPDNHISEIHPDEMKIPYNLVNLRKLVFRFLDFQFRIEPRTASCIESFARSILSAAHASRFKLAVSRVLPTLEDSVDFVNRAGESLKLPELYREEMRLQGIDDNYDRIVEVHQIQNLFGELAPILWVAEPGIDGYYSMIAYKYVEVCINILR